MVKQGSIINKKRPFTIVEQLPLDKLHEILETLIGMLEPV